MKPRLTVIIICGSEPEMIVDCLKSCSFADQIVLVTTYSTDKNTISLAKSAIPGLTIGSAPKKIIDYSYWRNTGISLARHSWILFVDADERITPQLQREINSAIQSTRFTNYDIPRANYFLGHRVRHGNSWPDYVKRLFLKSHFHGYQNALHEQPLIDGPAKKMTSPFLHYTHRNLTAMLQKSILWTAREAQLLSDSGHPPVVWWRFPRMMLTKLWQRLIRESMWRDGIVGFISVIFEVYDTYMIYAQLYQLQIQHD